MVKILSYGEFKENFKSTRKSEKLYLLIESQTIMIGHLVNLHFH